MHDAYDDTTSLLDNTVPLGEFLDDTTKKDTSVTFWTERIFFLSYI